MKLACFAFTGRGVALAAKLETARTALGDEFEGYTPEKYLPANEANPPVFRPLKPDLASVTGDTFSRCDALIFVGACGIAVRAIAPFVRSKTTDPAVVVIDESGRFAISLLSGHIGGANDLAEELAGEIGACPVVTTATDGRSLLAIDRFAAKSDLHIGDMKAAKAVSAALLDGKTVGLLSDFPLNGSVPKGFAKREAGTLGVCISLDDTKRPFEETLTLVPRIVTLGIGCRKGIEAGVIETAVARALSQQDVSPFAVKAVCSIDLKKDEAGLLAFCREKGWPFQVFSSKELSEVSGDFSPSSFVREVTGVDNVCERAAVLGSGGGALCIKKQAEQGVTVAAAVSDWRVCFED